MDSKTVLVVEDNELNLKLARNLLEIGKYKALCCGNAADGIRLANEHIPDLILMDIQLPDMDGLSATRQLKNNPKTREIPVVALTAYAMEKDKALALEAGCVDHISKPIDTKKFIPMISKYFSEGKRESYKPKSKGKPFVLIVDDDTKNVKFLDTLLSIEGLHTDSACDGTEAIEKAHKCLPDMILLDIMMPGINGYEVTRILKNDPETSNIPIILVTSLDSVEDKIRGMEVGADEFLNKPINKTELVARVRSLLKMKVYQEQFACRMRSVQEILKPTNQAAPTPEKEISASVLLVEDSQVDLNLFRHYLEKQPYRLITARTGEEAIELCYKEDVDLILLDLLLPGLDGYDVCSRLKENDQTRNIQILMVSSQNDLESKLKGIDLGADEFLIKPVNREEVVVRIRALVRKKQYMDQLVDRLKTALSASITDKLTELYNHAYLKHFMELEIKRCDRQHQKMAFIMIDVDDFKDYNDTYGHPAGDMLLKQFGRMIKRSIRDIDLAARYGGEEFGIVLPYTNREDAFVTAERILSAFRNSSVSEGPTRLCDRRTASMGIACYPDNGATVAEVIQRADEALYNAKKQGKNQICMY